MDDRRSRPAAPGGRAGTGEPVDESPEPTARPAWERIVDDPDAPLYTVGVVADLLGVAPQVVRGYDQRGLVTPQRSGSGHRRYSRNDIHRLQRAIDLADEGVSSAGIERILDLEDELEDERGRSEG